MRKWQRTVVAIAGLAMVLAVVPASTASAAGATQVSGSTAGGGPCDAPPNGAPSYVIPVNGDLTGCIYGYITLNSLHPSGTYQEAADEVFVGSWGDLEGTFELTEFYTAKFGADTPAGYYFGRCQHPIVAGSGTGGFEGVTGRLDFKDDPETGIAAYTGHLRFG